MIPAGVQVYVASMPVDCKRSSEALAIVCAQTWEHR